MEVDPVSVPIDPLTSPLQVIKQELKYEEDSDVTKPEQQTCEKDLFDSSSLFKREELIIKDEDEQHRTKIKQEVCYADISDGINSIKQEEIMIKDDEESGYSREGSITESEEDNVITSKTSFDLPLASKSELTVLDTRISKKIEEENEVATKQKEELSNEELSEVGLNNLKVCTVSLRENKKRKWDKRFLCLFCNKTFAQLPRHWYRKHSNEVDIKRILSLEKNSEERNILIEELQNRAAFKQNIDVMTEGEGLIMPKRRVGKFTKKNAEDYIPCQFCFRLFSKKYLTLHQKKCKFNKIPRSLKQNRTTIATNSLLLPHGPGVSEKFKEKFLNKMLHDDIFSTVQHDQTILKYGESEFHRLGQDQKYHRAIVERCRELGRLVLSAKDLDPNITTLNQLLNPSSYQLLKQSVFKAAGFNHETNLFETPSFARKIGVTVKKCATMLKGDYLRDDILKEHIPTLNSFLSVMESKWSTEVSSHALRTLSESKLNKTNALSHDIQKLIRFLNLQSAIEVENLETSSDISAFRNLVEITLVMLIMLNRTRVGEVQYILLKDYERAAKCDTNSDVPQILSESEKQLSRSFIRLEIKVKSGCVVPILLTEKLQANIDLINRKRSECLITETNPYLFPSPKKPCGYNSAHKTTKKWIKAAGCENVSSLVSTKLRKHVAMMVQLLNLREHDLDSLAKFLGHDIHIHSEYYQLADDTTHLSKISKLLLNMDKGNLSEIGGKNTDEIRLEDKRQGADSDEEFDSFQVLTQNSKDGCSDEKNLPKGKVGGTEEKVKKLKQQNIESTVKGKEKTIKSKKKSKNTTGRQAWTEKERKVVEKFFNPFIVKKKVPQKNDVDRFFSGEGNILAYRHWKNIKDFVYNKIRQVK